MGSAKTAESCKALKVSEIAELWGVSEQSIYREIWAGRIEHFRVGTQIRVRPEALERFVRDQEGGAVQPVSSGRGRKKGRKKRTAS